MQVDSHSLNSTSIGFELNVSINWKLIERGIEIWIKAAAVRTKLVPTHPTEHLCGTSASILIYTKNKCSNTGIHTTTDPDVGNSKYPLGSAGIRYRNPLGPVGIRDRGSMGRLRGLPCANYWSWDELRIHGERVDLASLIAPRPLVACQSVPQQFYRQENTHLYLYLYI